MEDMLVADWVSLSGNEGKDCLYECFACNKKFIDKHFRTFRAIHGDCVRCLCGKAARYVGPVTNSNKENENAV